MLLIIFTVFSYTPDFLLRLLQPFIYDAKKRFILVVTYAETPFRETRTNITLEIHYFNEGI